MINGIYVGLVGMAGAFLALGILSLSIVCLQRLFSPPPAETKAAESEPEAAIARPEGTKEKPNEAIAKAEPAVAEATAPMEEREAKRRAAAIVAAVASFMKGEGAEAATAKPTTPRPSRWRTSARQWLMRSGELRKGIWK